jgi:putative membrane protein
MVTLDNGVSDLLNGTVTLGNGINDLGSGAKTLQSGAKKVNNGAGDLADGIVKFNDEGVSKISEAFDGDIRSFSDRLQAVNQASEDYTSFGGAASDQKSTVKFFFKTAGITTDEDSSNS